MKREATISTDGLYRFDLIRTVEPSCSCDRCLVHPTRNGYVLWVLSNPSTADATTDDPTERRGWGYTAKWGFGGMCFVNTNPYRSTDPKKAQLPDETILATNDLYLMEAARRAALIICAWGTSANPFLARRALHVLKSASSNLNVLGLTKDGTPKHPLYLSGNLAAKPWKI